MIQQLIILTLCLSLASAQLSLRNRRFTNDVDPYEDGDCARSATVANANSVDTTNVYTNKVYFFVNWVDAQVGESVSLDWVYAGKVVKQGAFAVRSTEDDPANSCLYAFFSTSEMWELAPDGGDFEVKIYVNDIISDSPVITFINEPFIYMAGYYRKNRFVPGESPVFFTIHSLDRNPVEYYHRLREELKVQLPPGVACLIISPYFNKRSRSNYQNLYDEVIGAGRVDRFFRQKIYDRIAEDEGLLGTEPRYAVAHAAGAQFLQRFQTFFPDFFDIVVYTAPGNYLYWYENDPIWPVTLKDTNGEIPDGMLEKADPKAFMENSRTLIIVSESTSTDGMCLGWYCHDQGSTRRQRALNWASYANQQAIVNGWEDANKVIVHVTDRTNDDKEPLDVVAINRDTVDIQVTFLLQDLLESLSKFKKLGITTKPKLFGSMQVNNSNVKTNSGRHFYGRIYCEAHNTRYPKGCSPRIKINGELYEDLRWFGDIDTRMYADVHLPKYDNPDSDTYCFEGSVQAKNKNGELEYGDPFVDCIDLNRDANSFFIGDYTVRQVAEMKSVKLTKGKRVYRLLRSALKRQDAHTKVGKRTAFSLTPVSNKIKLKFNFSLPSKYIPNEEINNVRRPDEMVFALRARHSQRLDKCVAHFVSHSGVDPKIVRRVMKLRGGFLKGKGFTYAEGSYSRGMRKFVPKEGRVQVTLTCFGVKETDTLELDYVGLQYVYHKEG